MPAAELSGEAADAAPLAGALAVPAAPLHVRLRSRLAASDLRWPLAAVALMGLALGLRLWGLRSGLPYSYNIDESGHFAPKAVALAGGSWNPHYFVNPPAYTYLLRLVYAVWYGGAGAIHHAFAANPGGVYALARAVAALLGAIAVGLLYVAGARIFDRRTGLLAAGVLAVGFLPVFYSHLALNDVPTLAPLTLSLVGVGGILRRGRLRDFALAGLGLGLACATKYTGGIVVLPLIAAAVGCGRRRALAGLGLAAAIALAAFLLANPYSILDWHEFWQGIGHQSAATDAAEGKLGLTQSSGVAYYLWTLTWGLGWLPAIAALGGAILLGVRRSARFWLLVPAPLVFLVFMGTQGRFFGRWLMPIFPLVCLLAAYGAFAAVDTLAARRAVLRPALVAVAVVALCVQGLIYSVHSGLVLSRDDTRAITRTWMVSHVPALSRVVIEPGVVPNAWASDIGHPSALSGTGDRWVKFHTLRSQLGPGGTLVPGGHGPVVKVEDYERTLAPALVGEYERRGFCWVVTGSTQQGRALADPGAVPLAIAYYRRLARDGRVVFRASPYAPGDGPVAFNFDWSFDYEPLAYERPGPVMTVYRLTRGACRAGSG